jgi:glycosyltransferase involved in cell wall biosynthesis
VLIDGISAPQLAREKAEKCGFSKTKLRELAMISKTRLVYGSIACVDGVHSLSGSAFPFYTELTKSFNVIGAINASLPTAEKYLIALLQYIFHRDLWRERCAKNPLAFRRRRQIAEKQMRKFRDGFDFYLQQQTLFSPVGLTDKAYGITADTTHAEVMREWPRWSPLSDRELRRFLALEKETYDNARVLFPWSEHAARSLIEDYGQSSDKIVVVGSGVNFLKPVPEHGRYDGKTLLFIGYDFERKGGPDVLAAFNIVASRIPDVRLRIAGPRSAAGATSTRSRIEWLGPVRDRSMVSQLYQESSLFVMPSVFEPWGSVYLEALAHGVPCIGCNSRATSEVILDGIEGLLVPRRDPEALADAVCTLLRDPDRLAAMGTHGRKRTFSECTWSAVVQRMKPTIDTISNSK